MRGIRVNLDEVLSRIAAGERLVVTRRGKPVAELHPLRPEGRQKREVPPPRHPKRAAVMGEYDRQRQQRLEAVASAMSLADATTMDEYRAETVEWEEFDDR